MAITKDTSTLTGQTVLYEINTGIAIDYSPYYSRIATALETIATQTTTIAQKTTIIANMLTDMEAHQQKLRELGEGPGIHIVGAYDAFGMVTLYRLLIEQAKILDNTETASPTQIQAALAEAIRLVGLIRTNVPKEF